MARARDDHDGCQWFSGARCYCDACKGTSLFRVFRKFALLFHMMENDDTFEKILDTVREIDPDEEMEDMEDAIDQAMEQNKDAILEKYNDTVDRLDGENGGSGLKLNPWIG